LTKFEKWQGVITIVLSLSTGLIAWKTYDLNERTTLGSQEIQRLSAQINEERLEFDIVRDIYDRTTRYLASEQNEKQGIALVALITSIPESLTRSQLLSVISANSTSVNVATVAAEKYTRVSPSLNSTNSSEFIGEFVLELSDSNIATLKQDFGFRDSSGTVWMAPAGTQTEGASIPVAFQGIIGSNFDRQFLKAVVIHDYYSSTRERSYQSTHKMLFEALLVAGVSELKAKIFYAAVQTSGPRWPH